MVRQYIVVEAPDEAKLLTPQLGGKREKGARVTPSSSRAVLSGTGRPPTRSHLLKVLLPLNITKLGTTLSAHGHLGDILDPNYSSLSLFLSLSLCR
jgi:hypothetical protein